MTVSSSILPGSISRFSLRARRSSVRTARVGAAATVAIALLASACGESSPGKPRAYRIESRNQTIGGPAALAEVGDYVLENGVIRAAFLAEGNSVGPGMFGGSLIDIDLVRRDGRHPPGRRNDQFSELFPMVNLVIPGYVDDPVNGADIFGSRRRPHRSWRADARSHLHAGTFPRSDVPARPKTSTSIHG